MRKPSNNPVTLPFGATSSPYSASSPHTGVDFGWVDASGKENKTIVMPESGTVTLVPSNGNDGNGVYFTVGNRFHGLLHTSQYLVSNGAFVQEGTPVAIMGETGAAQGVHLHWALKVNGQFVNALDYVNEEENMPSTTGDVEARDLIQMGYGYTNELDIESAVPGLTGMETNTAIRTVFASPSHAGYLQYVEDLKKAAASPHAVTVLPPGEYKVQ